MAWKNSVLSGLGIHVRFCAAVLTLIAAFSLSGCGGSSSPVGVSVTASATTVDATDSVTLTATVANDKNAAGVSWSVSGGGALSSSTTTSTTYTAPAASSTALTVTVTATSVADSTKNQTTTLTVPAAPTITSAATDIAGSVGAAYSVQLKGSGGIAPYKNWALASGSSALPACLTLSSAGVLSTTSGTPPTATCAGTYTNLIFTFTDSGTPTALTATSQPVSLTIAAAPAITFGGSMPTTATYNVAYAGSSAASGGAGGLTYSKSGSWPSWLSLNASTGAVSGTPTAAGTFTFTVQAADAFGDSNSQQYTVAVSYPAMTITAPTMPTGYVGSVYKQTTLVATGGTGVAANYTWAVSAGALPAGLNLSTAGVITGTPTGSTGATSFSVTVTDTVANISSTPQQLSITVDAGITINSVTLPTGYVGSTYTQTTLTATGGTGAGTYTWTVASGSALPAGLSLSSAGAISGKPSGAPGTTNFTVTVTDTAQNTKNAQLSILIDAGVTVNAITLPAGYLNAAYPGATFTATGGTGTYTTWAWTGEPAGLTLNASTGAITGTPTVAGTFSVVVTATDSAGNMGTATFPLDVESTLTVTSANTLPSGTVGTTYSQQLAATGGTGAGTYTWIVTSGGSGLTTLGLSLSSTGLLSSTGALATQGSATFGVQVADTASHTATATLSVTVSTMSITTTTLPVGYTGSVYPQTTLAVTGGTSPYTWSVTNGATSLSALGLSLSSGGVLSSSAALTTTGSANITVQVSDSNNIKATASYTVVVYNPLALPPTNPSSLPSTVTTGVLYTGTITASGGSGNYSWAVTGLSDNLSPSSAGNLLTISGTPGTATTVSFTVKLTDTATSATSSQSYSIVVSAPGQLVSGQITLNNCSSGNMPPITVSINTSPVQTTTTDSNGNYSFSNVPNGNWTVTPSITAPPASVFLPNNQLVSVNGSSVTANFSVALGYTVSGTVSYSGSHTGQTYVTLRNNSCGGGSSLGTSISAPGSFTIRGVAPGTYTLTAEMEIQGYGDVNASDPSVTPFNVTVSTANLTGVSVAMTDPAAVTLGTGPKLKTVNPADKSVLISFKPIVDSNNVEMATSYTLQWSTDSTFTSVTGSQTFAASGTKGANIWVVTGLANSQTYYFRAEGMVGSPATSTSSWSAYASAVTIGAPTTGNTVSGAVTFTGTATGPLYVGFYDQTTNQIYAAVVGSKTSPPTSPAPFTVDVPTGSNYYFFGTIDQNNDGLIDPGDITNTHDNGANAVSIAGNTTNDNLTLPSSGSTATVTTQLWQQTSTSGTNSGYNLSFNVRESNKLPVAAALTQGPSVLVTTDIGVCFDCGTPQFQYTASLGSVTPVAGDQYSLLVTYSDGTSETLTAAISAVLTTSSLPTNLSPTTGVSTSTTPTFSWTDPTNASSYTYQFYLSDSNGNTIWQIPGNNSNSNGFDSSITSLTWNVDPTGGGSTTLIPSLSTATVYNWQIQAQDSNGNSAQSQVSYQP